MPAPTIEPPITTDIAGVIACLPHVLGRVPEPSTLVVCALAEGRHIATLTLPLANALLAGAPDVVADAVRENDGDAVVIVAYHEATIQTVADIATHMALALDHRGLEVIGVAHVLQLVIAHGRPTLPVPLEASLETLPLLLGDQPWPRRRLVVGAHPVSRMLLQSSVGRCFAICLIATAVQPLPSLCSL